MTRDEKASLRAQARERRRRPRSEEPSDEEGRNGAEQEEEPKREERPRARHEPPRGADPDEFADVAGRARELLRSLRGVDAESVSGLARTPNGWKVKLEVVELRRIPESTDVLASYEVELDDDGKFLGFERGRRYHRAQAELDGRR